MSEPAAQPLISVVLPMYEEQEVLDAVLDAVASQLARLAIRYEIVCVDDGSQDDTLARLEAAAAADEHIVVVALSRNFGKEAAMAAGLSAARGDAVLLMDADLQHPPELLPKMIALWQEGFDVVSAIKQSRARESLTYRFMANLFNVLMGRAAGVSFQGASDFKLLDRQVVTALESLPEKGRFFRGLVTWVGFRETTIPFTVRDRAAGHTHWSTLGLVRYSLRNLISFSSFPLKLAAWLGLVTLVLAMGLGVQTFWRWAVGGAVSGFTTVILLQLILGALTLVSVGVIAVYLAEIYAEVKGRPTFVVRRPAARRRRPGVRRKKRAAGRKQSASSPRDRRA